MDADPRDARIAELEKQLREAWLAFDSSAHLQNEIERLRLADNARRKRGGDRLPDGAWEVIADAQIIECAMDALKRLWHKDDDYRKASMHLSRMAWSLRKKCQEL